MIMSRKALIVLAAAASIGLLAPGMAQARGGMGGHGGMGGGMGGHGMGGHGFGGHGFGRGIGIGAFGLGLGYGYYDDGYPYIMATTTPTMVAAATSCVSASTPDMAGVSGQ
jgi:hypothetical protein